MKRCAISLILAALAVLSVPTSHAQDSLERGLMQHAPALIKHFQKEGYRNVGVLKFLVSRDGQPFTDNVGALNLMAARRLELALILANDPRTPIGLINNASDVAQKIPGASHLSKEGRAKLFSADYPLAWGKEKVRPDAFVTGTVGISKDLRTLTLTLYCFDLAANKLAPIGADFKVVNATDRLSEMGESFVLRGAFDDGKVENAQAKNQEKVYQEAAKVRDEEVKHPAQQGEQPVTLEIFYDNKKAPIEFRGGKAFVAEPREGQTVHFGLSRDSSKNRYGVVLKVNGENTFDKERLPDLSCRKWVLYPDSGPWEIRGFQIGNDKREKFRVASLAESKAREVYYGADVGTITMTVFREQKSKTRPKFLAEEELAQAVIQKLAELPVRPNNYGALKAQLLEDANRGLIVGGEREPSKIETVSFTADPTPMGCWTIVYYRK